MAPGSWRILLVERERAMLVAVTASMSHGMVVFRPDRRVQYANQRP